MASSVSLGGIDEDDTADIPTTFRRSYEDGDTDGIMELAASSDLFRDGTSVVELIQASIDAADGRNGMAASILNGLLGGCVLLTYDSRVGAQKSMDLIDAWEDISKEEGIYPDLVSYCLVYSALHPIIATEDGEEYFVDAANEMLEKARRLAKKAGGTQYRKATAKARRKGGQAASYAKDNIEALRERYGSDFNILFEDDDVLVVSKPSGMVCYHQRKTTAGKVGRKKRKKGVKQVDAAVDADISLVDALVDDASVRLSTLNPKAAGIVHRIDRGTSGCIVLAKSDEMHALLVGEFFTRGAHKAYDALIPARPVDIHANKGDKVDTLPDSGEINLPINDKSARSKFEVVKRFSDDANAIRIRMETFTGRKHQVRRHAAEGLSRPLYLDAMYWKSKSKNPATAPTEDHLPDAIAKVSQESSRKDDKERFFLHAASLRIPKLGIDVEAPLPSWWQEVEKELS